MENPLVSVVIVSFNKKDLLKKAINSVYNQTYKNLELIVIDNNSTDGSINLVVNEYPSIRHIVMPNSGYGACETINIGMASARGEFIVVMDDDATLNDNWITILVEKFSTDDNLGVICGKVINAFSNKVEWLYARPIDEWVSKEFKTSHFHGAATGFRKSILDKIKYYDEDYFIYVNEPVLGAKIVNSGYAVIFYPDLISYHNTHIRNPNKRSFYFLTRNHLWYVWTYFNLTLLIDTTTKILIISALSSIKRGYFFTYLKAIFSAIAMLPKIIAIRKPLPNNVIDHPIQSNSWNDIFKKILMRS